MDVNSYIYFIFIITLLVMSPGPNGFLVAKTVPASGRTAGFCNVAGFMAAFYIHGVLSILGLSAILSQSKIAFDVIKYIGAAYLVWIGLKALISIFKKQSIKVNVPLTSRKITLSKAFGEGLLTNIFNPKPSIFYLAVFPQFIEGEAGAAALMLLLVSTHAIINGIWFSILVILFSYTLHKTFSSMRFQIGLKAITGFAFIGFAVKLATYQK